jgi:hypothetical protein
LKAGVVQSLARPRGNVTGMTNQFSDLHDKTLQLAREEDRRLEAAAVITAATSGSGYRVNESSASRS